MKRILSIILTATLSVLGAFAQSGYTVEGVVVDEQGPVSAAAAGNWWHRELGVSGGKIVYRAAGDEVQDSFDTVAAGQTITLDFNAGTGTIK